MAKMDTPLLGLLALVLLLLLNLVSPTSSCTEQEISSLLQFLNELLPASSSNLAGSWQNGTSCCAWEGITCDANDTVTGLSLPSKGLEGYISASLVNLTGLLRLDLSRNSLSGGLPLELMSSGSIAVLDVSFNRLNGPLQDFPSSTMHHPLEVLNISNNFFAGEFPSTVWEKKRNLVAINASHNSFSGEMPSSFCISSPSLATIDISNNLFSGSIPTGIGKCSALRVLKAGYNSIAGAFPGELFGATLLEHLSFRKNGLEGELDGEHVSQLHHLVILDLGWNNFISEIPGSIGQLRRLEELHLDYNAMTGELPSALGTCTSLRIVNIKSNSFEGELLKVNFSSLPNLEILDLMLNNFTGEIPESLYSCSKLTTLQLTSNKFHGQLSPRIGNLKSLSFLSLANNTFVNIANTLQVLKNSRKITTLFMGTNFKNEDMPEDVTIVDGFQSLQILSIDSCSLSGKIPLWMSKLANLEILDLSGNKLTGPIPVWIDTLQFLYYLDISNNMLTGDLPTAIMEMPMLQSEKVAAHLDPRVFELVVYTWPSLPYRMMINTLPTMINLGSNNFTGAIPPEVGQLKSLVILNLSSNSLSGEIPQQICDLANLLVVDLSSNYLTGSIPSALNNLHFLSTFDVSNNDLEGAIPTGMHFYISAYGNPKLCDPLLAHPCDSVKAPPEPTLSTERATEKLVFAVAFTAFFCVGVIYDQLVLPRFFG